MGKGYTRIDRSKVAVVVGGMAAKAGERAANKMADRARANVVADGLVNTGQLLHSFKVENRTTDPLKPRYRVFSTDPKAKYPERGTRGSVAAPGRVLRFKPKGGGVYVFAKRTGPVRAYRFMERARDATTVRDFTG